MTGHDDDIIVGKAYDAALMRRLMGYLRPYWHKLAASMACWIMFSLFSGMSIYMTIPLLETLFFKPEATVQTATRAYVDSSDITLSGGLTVSAENTSTATAEVRATSVAAGLVGGRLVHELGVRAFMSPSPLPTGEAGDDD